MTNPKHILVSGAGIAGPALALLLTRSGHAVTIIERATSLRSSGQQIDISGRGQDAAKFMGIEADLRKRSIREQGLRFVDAANRPIAEFPVTNTHAFVKEIEILRGDMVDVLYQHTKDTVEYVFGDSITALNERESCITVSFDKGSERDFDLVVAADGQYSRTRDLAFGKENAQVVSLKQCVALFTMPYATQDENWWTWYTAPGGRGITLRPQVERGVTGGYLLLMTEESGRLARLEPARQKEEFARRFRDAGWEAERVVREMERSEDFYVQQTAQIKAKKFASGRVALLGDAGYCPSPVTGQGTTLAFVGAYILAGCIATYPDHREALRRYEEEMRPFVTKSQSLPPGVPAIALPQSAWGVQVSRYFVWGLGWLFKSGVISLLGRFFGLISGVWVWGGERQLPKYAALKGEMP